MTSQNPRRDDLTLVRRLAEMEHRLRSLETAPRAGHTSISNGKLLVMDPATGNVIASLAGASGTDAYGNAFPAGLGANVGSMNGGIVQPGTIDKTKVNFVARDISGVTTTTSATAPASPVVGDLWIDTGNGNLLKRWDGSGWVALPVGTNAISAGAVTASQIAANTITAGQLAAGSVTAASIAAGAIDAMTINGATINGTVVNGSTINGTSIIGSSMTVQSTDGGMFVYDGAPALGNLIVSIAATAGTDDYGNSYPKGVDVNAGSIAGSLISIEPGPNNGIFVYGTVPQVTTLDSGSGTWTAPAGVTSVKVECWGGGGGGGGYKAWDNTFATYGGGSGGCGGEYASERALAVTPGTNYAYTVGAAGSTVAAGNGTAGGNTVFGSNLVVAHGGDGGLVSGYSQNPGTGSTNTVHFNGGMNGLGSAAYDYSNGGSGSGAAGAGGGGGGSGGYASVGNFAGDALSGTAGGAGAAAVTGGGAGGNGGTSTLAGVVPAPPGGGGGGAGSKGTAGKGGNGRITLTYTTSTTPQLIASLAGSSGTDQYGNPYPAGIFGTSVTIGSTDITGAWKTYTPTWTASTSPTLGNGTLTGRYMLIGKTCFAVIQLTFGSTTTLGAGNYVFGMPFTSANSSVGYLGLARYQTGSQIWLGQCLLAANSAVTNATFPTNSTTTTASHMNPTTPAAPVLGSSTLTLSLTYQIA